MVMYQINGLNHEYPNIKGVKSVVPEREFPAPHAAHVMIHPLQNNRKPDKWQGMYDKHRMS